MNNIEILKKAIENKKQIKYFYYNEKKPLEKDLFRIGNPHIIFYSASKNKPKDIILVHIWEKYKDKETINKFKAYEVDNLNDIELLDCIFEVDDTYKPNSYYYRNGVIYKI